MESFNPHTHAGCDSLIKGKIKPCNVSIHTPTQGVTWISYLLVGNKEVSIHTPTQGVTIITYLCRLLRSCFNPHTHAGCDHVIFPYILKSLGFNPHTHAGCDSLIKGKIKPCNVSIHTPTQGVTIQIGSEKYKEIVSIHTPTQGVTHCYREQFLT